MENNINPRRRLCTCGCRKMVFKHLRKCLNIFSEGAYMLWQSFVPSLSENLDNCCSDSATSVARSRSWLPRLEAEERFNASPSSVDLCDVRGREKELIGEVHDACALCQTMHSQSECLCVLLPAHYEVMSRLHDLSEKGIVVVSTIHDEDGSFVICA
jgi:hypothetical protein